VKRRLDRDRSQPSVSTVRHTSHGVADRSLVVKGSAGRVDWSTLVPLAMKMLALTLALAVALACLALACAPRAQLCGGARGCAATSDCVAGQCLPKDATLPYAGARRLVLRPVDIALLDGNGPSGGALPPVFTMGRANASGVELLLRFDVHLDRATTLLRASILLDRADAALADRTPIALHAARVIGAWSPERVSKSTAPAVQDLRLPSTWVDASDPSLVRIDVTSLARRWLRHDPADQGVVLVAENTNAVGVTFALGGRPAPPNLDPHEEDSPLPPQPPRLEIYAR
jgi:hypothetical protein